MTSRKRSAVEAYADRYASGHGEGRSESGYIDGIAAGLIEGREEADYNDGYAEGASYAASEIVQSLDCNSITDCTCQPHQVIRPLLSW